MSFVKLVATLVALISIGLTFGAGLEVIRQGLAVPLADAGFFSIAKILGWRPGIENEAPVFSPVLIIFTVPTAALSIWACYALERSDPSR